jgi:hypothetical protein
MELPSHGCDPLDHSRERHHARMSLRTLLVTAAALLTMAGPALAADTICTGPLDPAGSPYGNVVVPAGESCLIMGVRVDGNVTVFGSLTVIAQPIDTVALPIDTTDTTIGGNVNTKDGCGTVVIHGSGAVAAPQPAPSVAFFGRVVIGGNVTIDHCQQGSIGAAVLVAPAFVDNVTVPPVVLIGKNLKCSNTAAGCTVDHAVVGGNAELSGNDGFVSASVNFVGGKLTANKNGGQVILSENAIGGDLKCKDNVGPVTETLNTVAGSKQCEIVMP